MVEKIAELALEHDTGARALQTIVDGMQNVILSDLRNPDITQIIFEVISAIGTVGLTMGLTEHAMIPTKIIITFLMYIGRLGALTLFDLILRNKNNSIVQKPEGKVLVG